MVAPNDGRRGPKFHHALLQRLHALFDARDEDSSSDEGVREEFAVKFERIMIDLKDRVDGLKEELKGQGGGSPVKDPARDEIHAAVNVWRVGIDDLHKACRRGRPIVRIEAWPLRTFNAMVKVPQATFTCTDPGIRRKTLAAWKMLTITLALRKETTTSTYLRLLITPLVYLFKNERHPDVLKDACSALTQIEDSVAQSASPDALRQISIYADANARRHDVLNDILPKALRTHAARACLACVDSGKVTAPQTKPANEREERKEQGEEKGEEAPPADAPACAPEPKTSLPAKITDSFPEAKPGGEGEAAATGAARTPQPTTTTTTTASAAAAPPPTTKTTATLGGVAVRHVGLKAPVRFAVPTDSQISNLKSQISAPESATVTIEEGKEEAAGGGGFMALPAVNSPPRHRLESTQPVCEPVAEDLAEAILRRVAPPAAPAIPAAPASPARPTSLPAPATAPAQAPLPLPLPLPPPRSRKELNDQIAASMRVHAGKRASPQGRPEVWAVGSKGLGGLGGLGGGGGGQANPKRRASEQAIMRLKKAALEVDYSALSHDSFAMFQTFLLGE